VIWNRMSQEPPWARMRRSAMAAKGREEPSPGQLEPGSRGFLHSSRWLCPSRQPCSNYSLDVRRHRECGEKGEAMARGREVLHWLLLAFIGAWPAALSAEDPESQLPRTALAQVEIGPTRIRSFFPLSPNTT
jgi:hypothetical protein